MSKPRPVLIIQDDHYVQTQSITICPLTSQDAEAGWWRTAIEPTQATGLTVTSYVQIDKITTTRRSNLAHCIGQVSPGQMSDVSKKLAAFLGMAG
ncbi:MAG: type II toxin-antitoxin system PemK/MazF family toxin [Propionibacteriaceae bacterium]|nr:type II toxin-antitoxin system PemK/MazF family toxin [Propionibacteriaceae bacterium]